MLPRAMPTVRFTRHLQRFFPALRAEEGERVDAATVRDVVAALDARYPGLAAYLVDDVGRLRRHVNIFKDGGMLADRHGLTDAVSDDTELLVVQALSGG
jgi:molybdopterin synthase sulfur carrier subunit